MKARLQHSEADQCHVHPCFDLEKLLGTPHSEGMLIEFSRKYACYNLTVSENVSKNGYYFFGRRRTETKGQMKSQLVFHSELQTLIVEALSRL